MANPVLINTVFCSGFAGKLVKIRFLALSAYKVCP